MLVHAVAPTDRIEAFIIYLLYVCVSECGGAYGVSVQDGCV